MAYILIGESFQMVDGPYKGKKYLHGKKYSDIPPTEKKRFKEVKEKSERGARKAEGGKPATQTADKPADKKNEGSDDKPKASGVDKGNPKKA